MNEKKGQTAEQRLAEAETHLTAMEEERDDARAALDEAKEQVEHARDCRDRLRDELEKPIREAATLAAARLVAEHTGPMRPIGERSVRLACTLQELPKDHAMDASIGGSFKALGDAVTWVTNGHWMVRAESANGLDFIRRKPEEVIGPRGAPVVRDDVPGKVNGMDVRTFGRIAAVLKYTSLIEDLFPGLAWHCDGRRYDALQAVVNGEIVAVVMPCTDWSAHL